MPPRARMLYSIFSLLFLLAAATPLIRELSQRSDIWWTPQTMLVPLAQSKDRVEVYARGKPLDALLEAGQLQTSQAGGSSTLATSDIGLRFNNWDHVRVLRLPMLLLDAAACGAIMCLLLLFATGRITYHDEKAA
jgi:hypothetical protein